MEFDEKLLKKIKNKIEFDKTKSELLIEFISKMGKVGDDLKKHLNAIMKNSFRIKNEIKNKFNLYDVDKNYNQNLKSKEIVAIDGSSNIGGQLSGKFVCLYSVARIHILIDQLDNILPSEYYWGDLEIIDALDEIKIKELLEIKMIQKETEAYNDSIQLFDSSSKNHKVIFVDGPVIDPPAYKEEKFVNYRCNIIKNLISNNIILIGCVKRIFSSDFCKYITNLISNEDLKNKIKLYLNDSYLISSLMADYRKQNNFHGVIITDFYKNLIYEKTASYQYYMHDVEVRSLFFQYSTKHNLIRVDIPFIKSEEIDLNNIYEIVKTNLIEWSYPGIDIPYPVYLAHDFSKIRNGCAQKIYDDIISKNLSNKPVGQLLINMLK